MPLDRPTIASRERPGPGRSAVLASIALHGAILVGMLATGTSSESSGPGERIFAVELVLTSLPSESGATDTTAPTTTDPSVIGDASPEALAETETPTAPASLLPSEAIPSVAATPTEVPTPPSAVPIVEPDAAAAAMPQPHPAEEVAEEPIVRDVPPTSELAVLPPPPDAPQPSAAPTAAPAVTTAAPPPEPVPAASPPPPRPAQRPPATPRTAGRTAEATPAPPRGGKPQSVAAAGPPGTAATGGASEQSQLTAALAPAAGPPVITRAQYRERPTPPVYPRRARELNITGTTVLRALVDRDGRTREVRVWRSSGSEALDEAAATAARRWAFAPAQIDGRTVEAWVEIPVNFELR